jgi:hypothetical protein
MRGYWTARCCCVLPSRCSGLCIDDEPQTSHVARRTACLALFRSTAAPGGPVCQLGKRETRDWQQAMAAIPCAFEGRLAKDRHDAQGRIGRTITMAKVGMVLSCAAHTTPSRPLHSGHGINQQLNTVYLPATKIVASPTLPRYGCKAGKSPSRQRASARLPFAAAAPRPGNSLPQKATHHPAKLGVSTHVL